MSKTKRFKWVDRATSARDLIQLAYYAPHSISKRALWLLIAFPCQEIGSDLISIALDTDRKGQEREYALTVLGRIEGNIHVPELAVLLREDFAFQRQHYPENVESNETGYAAYSVFGRSLYELILNHPENIAWFCKELEFINDPHYAVDILTSSFAEDPSTNSVLAQWLNAFLEKRTDIFSKDSITRAIQWFKPRSSQTPLFDETEEQPLIDDVKKYEASPIWREFTALFQAAVSGNIEAFNRIRHIAIGWNIYLPLQGVALYFLGQLQAQYDVINDLCAQVKNPRDNWYFDDSGYADHPVRAEAIYALGINSSPQAWEALMDGFFVNPSNSLDYRFFDAIESVTELLSFKSTEAKHRTEMSQAVKPSARWFDVLCTMDHDLDYYLQNWNKSKIN